MPKSTIKVAGIPYFYLLDKKTSLGVRPWTFPALARSSAASLGVRIGLPGTAHELRMWPYICQPPKSP